VDDGALVEVSAKVLPHLTDTEQSRSLWQKLDSAAHRGSRHTSSHRMGEKPSVSVIASTAVTKYSYTRSVFVPIPCLLIHASTLGVFCQQV
jgi:hypothetical protein